MSIFIQRKVREVNTSRIKPSPFIHFVRAGQSATRRPKRLDFGLLNEARDWICDFDLPELHKDSTYAFPYDISVDSLRSDGYIVSRSCKSCIIVELTSPMEENIEFWHKEKLNKYSKIFAGDWNFHFLMFEVGCRGFIPSRLFFMLRSLGFTSRESKQLRDNLQLVVRKCSYIVWINRFNKDFQVPRVSQSTEEVRSTEEDS